MKKCPFCGADIEESARFCLYCMQPLTEKEQIPPHQKKKPQCFIGIAAIVMSILIVAVVGFSMQISLGNETTSNTSSVTESAHTPAPAVTENYVDSSCTQKGSYDEVVYCFECQEEISRTQKTLPKKPHDYHQKVTTVEYLQTAATCTDSAVYYYSCACGAKSTTTFADGEATGHSYTSIWEKDATYHWHKAACEHTAEISEKAEHSYGADNVCDTCLYDRTVNVSGVTLNFSYLSLTVDDVKTLVVTISPNNATNQNVTWVSSNTSVVTVDTNGRITAVDAGTATITVSTKDGNKTAQCTIVVSAKMCTHSSTQTEREIEIHSTCEATGVYNEIVYCSACGDVLSRARVTVPATGHTFGEWTVLQAPTCTAKGMKLRTCFCQEKETELIPASGHSFGEWVIDKASTCMETGTTHRICSACNGSESNMIPVNITAHNYDTAWTTDDTHHWHRCLNSGCSSVSGETAHVFGEWIVDTVATCTKAGTRHHVCSECQTSASETYSNPSAHNYDTAWTTDDTHHWHRCLNSGCSSVSGKTAHNMTDGACADCCVKNADYKTYTRDGNYIYFGEYPQSLKADNVTITANTDVRGYYVGSDGYYYARVSAHPRKSSYTFQSGSLIKNYEVYYFKVEPIRWRILSEDSDTALILCDSILTNRAYNDTRTATYEQSEIRAWLNDQFYNTVFSVFQKSLINTVLVDNDFGDITNDKVFLLNHEDIINTNYGFSSSDSTCDATRRMAVNDYARATGADMSNGFGTWLLGEAQFGSFADSMNVLLVSDDGRADDYSIMTGTCWGVVPALQIQLNDSDCQVDATGLAYRVNEDGTTCSVVGIDTFTETEVVIPTEINGLKVTSIGDAAFWGCTLTSITIPDSVKNIGKDAFGSCKHLTSIIFGKTDTLISIGSFAFDNCTNLRSITIPESVTTIGEFAFDNCSIYNVYITDIAAWCEISFGNSSSNPFHEGYLGAFYLNGQLVTDLLIPSEVTSIKNYAFKSCYGLTSVIIPNSVTSIGDYAFYDCFHLKSVTITDSVTTLGSYAFYKCPNLSKVTLGTSLQDIGKNAFRNCKSLESITIPDSVTSIGNEAFYGCKSLTSIQYLGTESQWQAINKGTDWDKDTGTYTVTYHYKG